jgi:TetR/AcrR family transcriptional regulator of autoinduction and epiphytic fitness
MSESVKRPYDGSRRQEQARRTRARIVDSASALFVEHGYGATSMTAIAEHAGVAPQTVYAAFGTKATLLNEAIGVAMAGDDEPVAIFDRPASQAAITAPLPSEAAARYARTAAALLERAGRLIQAADAAAQQDPELVAMWIQGHKHRLTDMRRTARGFDAMGYLRDGLSPDQAADLLWVVVSPDTFRAFTVIRGWSTGRYERWLATTVARVVLRPD